MPHNPWEVRAKANPKTHKPKKQIKVRVKKLRQQNTDFPAVLITPSSTNLNLHISQDLGRPEYSTQSSFDTIPVSQQNTESTVPPGLMSPTSTTLNWVAQQHSGRPELSMQSSLLSVPYNQQNTESTVAPNLHISQDLGRPEYSTQSSFD